MPEVTVNTISVHKQDVVQLRGAEFFKAASSLRQFTVLGDTNHSSPDIREVLAKEENIEALASSGVKFLFIEDSRDIQPAIDLFYDDYIVTKEGLARYFAATEWLWIVPEEEERVDKAFIDTITHCKNHGIKVIFAQKPSKVMEDNPDMVAIIRQYVLLDETQKHHYNNSLGKYIDSLEKATRRKYRDFSKDLKKEQRAMNPKLAKFILDTAKGERSVVFYGAGHSERPRDLDELLGQDNTTNIALFASSKAVEQYTFGQDRPDFVYFAEEERAAMLPTERSWLCSVPIIGSLLANCGVEEKNTSFSSPPPGPMPEQNNKSLF